MKANQAFKIEEEAVSPVIGVILMVAITVVLAAVVFVLVTKLSSSESDDVPEITFAVDENANSATVVSVEGSPIWDDFAFVGACSPTVTLADPVTAGDVLTCASTQRLAIQHEETNTLVYDYTFT